MSVTPSSDLLVAVVELGNAHKSTLGLIPRAVYAARAADGAVLAALDGSGQLAGYALYEVARGRVRLVQLCVDPRFRRRGVAGALVREISATHPELKGIKVKCRADYEAAAVWPRLGFAMQNEVVGRGKDRHLLEVWWLDHGVPDLFSMDADEDVVTVAIDHMVFIDLEIDPGRSGADESQVLIADWLTDRIKVTMTQESLNEIRRLPDESERSRHRAAASRYSTPTASPAAVQAARQTLLQCLPPDALSESDLNHVVHAAAAGAAVFATRDADLIATVADAAETSLGLKVLRPTDVAVLLDQLTDAERYRPAAIRGTGFSVQDIPAGSEGELQHLLQQASGERASQWRRLLRPLFADPTVSCQAVREPDGRVLVAWATRANPDQDALVVPLLRCAPTPIASTVLRLLLFELKIKAVAAGMARIIVTDPHVSRVVSSALADDSFVSQDAGWEALVVDARSRAVAAAALPDGHPWLGELQTNPSPATVGALERSLWPAKMIDTSLPSYIVSIQPRWARELFSLTDTLFERATLLGLSREHVYYRAPRSNPLIPARVLWYASGQGRDRIGAIVACSQLVEAVVDDPRTLHRRFRHLGVYDQQTVTDAARDGKATALRFIDTERFAYPVPFERLSALTADCPLPPLLSPTMISPEIFGALYREGTGRSGR